MSAPALHLYTVPSSCDPLRLIARKVLAGFPFDHASDLPLTRWNIILPSRRAARRMKTVFAEEAHCSSLLLPHIRAIADVEDDTVTTAHVLPGLAATTLRFAMARMVTEWASHNPHLELARDIASTPRQALLLTDSLVKLIDQIETEEVSFAGLSAFYDFTDLAGHREAVTGLLDHVQESHAKLLTDSRRIGAASRRNRLIRHVAETIASGAAKGPFIVAGSTGTNPATRDLLKAVASRSDGAVILPGLDLVMADADWLVLTPTHPQNGLKNLLGDLGAARSDVQSLADELPRLALIREVMRPSPRTDHWVTALAEQTAELRTAFQGVSLVEAEDRHEEALTIALVLREAVATANRTAALVTPDRDLASRVAAELARWNIVIEDSGGEPLLHHGQASLLARLITCITTDYEPASVISLLHHKDFNPVLDDFPAAEIARCCEVAARQYGLGAGPKGLAHAILRAIESKTIDHHVHPVLGRISDELWQAAAATADALSGIFETLDPLDVKSLSEHVTVLREALARLNPAVDLTTTFNVALEKELAALADASSALGGLSLADASIILSRHLAAEIIQPERPCHPRLAIYGLAEARMMQADVLLLGGLVEGKWPAQPDTGPWLNRPMRQALGLSPPERDIGLSAHDFAEGLGFEKVHVTWPRRMGRQPVVPSRWVLRLRMLLQGLGITRENQVDHRHLALARRLDAPEDFTPVLRPRPAPPVALRPTQFSVTEIETLIRDPYAVFARRILQVEPLRPLAEEAGAALRGTLLHGALESWNRGWPYASPDASRASLVAAGEQQFASLLADPSVAGFWWPRFLRVAEALVAAATTLDEDVSRILCELSGSLSFAVQGTGFRLKARMDRLDLFKDGTARLIDYKSGTIPAGGSVAAGFSPQLTLQAHMASQGAFKDAGISQPLEALYIGISGGRPAIEILDALRDGKKDKVPLVDVAASHFHKLQDILGSYLNIDQPYLPRARQFSVENTSPFDHLSRYREWQLAEG
jgi:ATP-dependent helicase/nuclease subunit B